MRRSFNALQDHFSASHKASRIDTRSVQQYAHARSQGGYANASINRELAALRRGFNLAAEQDLVRSIPVIRSLQGRNVRKGFLRSDDFERLYRALPRDVATLARVGYVTGWRSGELLSRKWKHCDLAGGWLRLEPGETKNEDGRMFPLPDILLRELEHQHHMADEVCGGVRGGGPLFLRHSGPHRGQPIRRFYRAWRKAAKEAGLEGTIFHDMRRSAIRNLVRSGVSETVAMRMTGHRTRSVFKRYDIVDERDLLEAMRR